MPLPKPRYTSLERYLRDRVGFWPDCCVRPLFHKDIHTCNRLDTDLRRIYATVKCDSNLSVRADCHGKVAGRPGVGKETIAKCFVDQGDCGRSSRFELDL